MSKPKAILLDIEGTIGSISFVKDVLFPYAYQALPEFVWSNADNEDVASIIASTCEHTGQPSDLKLAIKILQGWIESDQKIKPLKDIQGMIWESGYYSNAFQAHIYPDAYESICAFCKQELTLYIYSSGSVRAQELYFQHTVYGDMRNYFNSYFDISVGKKNDPRSYRSISEKIEVNPEKILFVSDVLEELFAAKGANYNVHLINRGSNADINRQSDKNNINHSLDFRSILNLYT